MPLPVGIVHNKYNPMKMIGHDRKRIQFHIWTHNRRIPPFLFNNFAVFVQHHIPIGRNRPKQAFPLMGANRDQIRAALRVIVIRPPDGTAMIAVRIVLVMGYSIANTMIITNTIKITPGRGLARQTPTAENICQKPESRDQQSETRAITESGRSEPR